MFHGCLHVLAGVLFQKQGQVRYEQFDRHGDQDNAEEFAEDIDTSLADQPFGQVDIPNDEIDDGHVQHDGDDDVDDAAFGSQRQGCGERSGSGDQREYHRDDGRVSRRSVVTEDFDVEGHLDGQGEKNQRAGDGKRFDIRVEEF